MPRQDKEENEADVIIGWWINQEYSPAEVSLSTNFNKKLKFSALFVVVVVLSLLAVADQGLRNVTRLMCHVAWYIIDCITREQHKPMFIVFQNCVKTFSSFKIETNLLQPGGGSTDLSPVYRPITGTAKSSVECKQFRGQFAFIACDVYIICIFQVKVTVSHSIFAKSAIHTPHDMIRKVMRSHAQYSCT